METNKMVKNIQSKVLSVMKILKLLIIALFISTNCIAHETTYILYKNQFSKFRNTALIYLFWGCGLRVSELLKIDFL